MNACEELTNHGKKLFTCVNDSFWLQRFCWSNSRSVRWRSSESCPRTQCPDWKKHAILSRLNMEYISEHIICKRNITSIISESFIGTSTFESTELKFLVSSKSYANKVTLLMDIIQCFKVSDTYLDLTNINCQIKFCTMSITIMESRFKLF